MRRAFTLLEVVVVIGIILILMSLALTVSSAVMAASDRRNMQTTFGMIDQAIVSWEAQAGRELTTGRRAVPTGTPGLPDFTLSANGPSAAYDIYEEAFPTVYAICVVLERLATNPESAEIIARIPSSSIRFVPLMPPGYTAAVEPLPNWPAAPNINRMPAVAGNSTTPSGVREIFDPWNRRVAVVFPGRAATKKEIVDGLIPIDEDGSVRTLDEQSMGVCRGRKLCFISAGPDGDFGTEGDNIYSYELLPRPQQ